MDGENIQQRDDQSREGEDIEYIADEKVPVIIKEIIRIDPRNFSALKHSFEEWAKQWD